MDLLQAVITTKYVIKYKSKVVFVYHSKKDGSFLVRKKISQKQIAWLSR